MCHSRTAEKTTKISRRYAIVSFVFVRGGYSPGETDFVKFVTSGTFVDKSLFIVEFMVYSAHANMITRPRRFGKSTNLSMLYTFLAPPLSAEDKVRRVGLFKDLKVAKFDWFIKLHFGNWPVICIGFKASELDVALTLHKKTNEPYFTRILVVGPGIQC